MLAIIFMPLLVVVAPMVSAGPLALPASPTPDGQAEVVVTITNPATATTTVTPSSPEDDAPRRTQQPELRDAPQPPPQAQQRDAGFATSPATTTTTNSATEEHTRVGDHAAAAAAAKTTPRPTDDPEADSELAREGYSQTTYYACETYAVSTHCGWHVPVVHVGGARRVVPGGAPGFVAAGAVMACGVFVNGVLGF